MANEGSGYNRVWVPLLGLAGLCVYEAFFVSGVYLGVWQWQRCGDRESLGGIIRFSGMILAGLPVFPVLIRDIFIRNPAKRRRYPRGYLVGIMVLFLGVVIAVVGYLVELC